MKATDLRIGNIVCDTSGIMIKIKEISKKLIRGNYISESKIDVIENIDTLQGIPLTEEILLKCPEFSKCSFSANVWKLRNPNSQFHLYYRDDMNRFVFRGLGMSVVYADTLHHLQNLVYVNTGQELIVEL